MNCRRSRGRAREAARHMAARNNIGEKSASLWLIITLIGALLSCGPEIRHVCFVAQWHFAALASADDVLAVKASAPLMKRCRRGANDGGGDDMASSLQFCAERLSLRGAQRLFIGRLDEIDAEASSVARRCAIGRFRSRNSRGSVRRNRRAPTKARLKISSDERADDGH